jgi:putative spermidine/putrescine transport system permease protein
MSRKRRSRFLTAFVICVYAFILLPLLLVIPVSFNTTSNFDLPTHGLSLRWYAALLGNQNFLTSLISVSLVAGLVTMLCATVIGTLSAIAIVRGNFPAKQIVQGLFLSPLIVPHILLGASLYLYFSKLGLNASMKTLILGHILIATPYVIRNVTSGLVGLNRSIEEAAVNLGAHSVRAFVLVAVPQLRSSLISGAVFAFIVSFSDINISLFLSGPNTTTLPVYLFSQIQWESDPSLAAASTVQMLVIVLLVIVLRKLFQVRTTTRLATSLKTSVPKELGR